MKVILLALIIAACTAAGGVFSRTRKRRCEALASLEDAIRILRIRILNSSEPMEALLRRSELDIFQRLGEGIRNGKDVDSVWRDIKESGNREIETLIGSDLEALDDFFARLGSTGREEQDALFSMTLERLEAASADAKIRRAEGAKTFTALGALTGIAVCVLIV